MTPLLRNTRAMKEEDTWIFGYGSLIWKAGFAFLESRPAYIRHRARRFWQGSTDHRGVPGAPGRVVTLVEASGEQCWGRAYRLDPVSREMVLGHLDHREKGGYERLDIRLHFGGDSSAVGITYHASSVNVNYLGPASAQEIASQINRAHGPSGSNAEYVLRLSQALQEMGVDDPHVLEIAALIRS
jgi:cation transport regulator ChaC